MNRIITEDLLAAVIQYLGTKPMAEVEGLVNALRQLPRMPTGKQESSPE
jgi:hypothetical protein